MFSEYYSKKLEQTPRVENSSSKSIRSLSNDIVLDKFNGEKFNTESWLKLFTKECERVGIPSANDAETLRLFLEKATLDWFNIFSKKNA